jgi:hypothetical protein
VALDREEVMTVTETWGVPGDRVIAKGTAQVIARLEALGEPGFAVDAYLEVDDESEWSAGIPLDYSRDIPQGEMWTVTLRGGVYRIEAGSAELYTDEFCAGDDEDEEPPPAVVTKLPRPASPGRARRPGSRVAHRRKARRKAERQAGRWKR